MDQYAEPVAGNPALKDVKILVALFALFGAAAVVTYTEIAYGFACEGDSCSVASAPTIMRILAWIALGGPVVAIVLARRHATAARASLLIAVVAFLVWIPLFVYVVEGDFPG